MINKLPSDIFLTTVLPRVFHSEAQSESVIVCNYYCSVICFRGFTLKPCNKTSHYSSRGAWLWNLWDNSS